MSRRDVEVLKDNLNTHGNQRVDIYNIYLKDIAKEDQFTDKIRLAKVNHDMDLFHITPSLMKTATVKSHEAGQHSVL